MYTSDYYPPGVTSVPGDANAECEHCHNRFHGSEFEECPTCNELAVCPSCSYCHECYMKAEDMKEDIEEVDVKCPICCIVANSEAWDEATQEIFGDNSEPLAKAFADKDGHEELWYICPHCSEQVDFDDMKVK